MNTQLTYVFQESERFIRQYALESGQSDEWVRERITEIHREIARGGVFNLSEKELAFGARIAWRNANRCIGRLFWKSLHVFDCREVKTPHELFERLCEHLKFATNGGAIRSAITIFPPSNPSSHLDPSATRSEAPLTILNHQLFRYAGYVQADGSILGDPMNVELTQQCMSLGWEPSHYEGRDGRFDLLPLVVKDTNGSLHWFTWPREVFLEVPITHDAYPQLDALNLRWYAVPVLSDMVLEIGGLQFPTAPFNGWYMGTEIGARNLADPHRYNLLPEIASCLGLDTSSNRNLWKDQALVILNQAVLQSYERAGVKMVDHHTASEQHVHFERTEASHQREVYGDWSWLVPPMSGASSSLFHREYTNHEKTPAFRNKVHTPHLQPATGCPMSKTHS